MWTKDPAKAFAIQSPGNDVAMGDPSGWERPRAFIEWFMKRYANDERLLAIEVMNEPSGPRNGRPGTLPFAVAMFKAAKAIQGRVPLTVGTARIEQADNAFVPLGLDIIQFHNNFPRDTAELEASIKAALALGEKTGLPVWLTEWQRLRTSASGFGAGEVSAEERGPDYASMAATVRRYPVGSFFWCLMVKRAYLRGQRLNGTTNGLFWPDGAVSSLKDAREVANQPQLQLKEKPIPSIFGQEMVGMKATASPKQ